ncbi:MAG: response regulator [Anaerolineae bacterium]|nr:response regulator [Anaerolineae bacterium]
MTTSILIVEDESVVALDIQNRLRVLGYSTVGIASRGEVAIQLAQQRHPALVLMDIRLKGEMDGIEAARQIRALCNIPVVYLTAFADEETLQRAKITGPFGYLIKPFEERDLHATIEMALYQHQTEQSLKMQAQALEQKNRHLSLLNRLLTQSTQGASPKVLLEDACCELSLMLHLPYSVAITLNGAGGAVLVYQAQAQSLSTSYALASDETMLLKHLFAHHPPISMADLCSVEQLKPLCRCFRDREIQSLLLLPLVVNESVIGAVGLAASEQRDFAETEVQLVESVIGQLAGVLARIWLTEERQRLSAALEQADTEVMITDLDGTILYVNPAFEHTTGFNKDEVLGKTPSLLSSGQHDAAFYRELWTTITANKMWRGHIVNKRKDGRLYTAETAIIPVRNGTAVPRSFVSLQRDVSHELEVQDQYHRALKMQAVGRLAAGLAHDFNNLLAAINGFAQLIQRHNHLSDRARVWVEGIIGATERASELAVQLLTFSRSDPQNPKTLDLNAIIDDAQYLLQNIVTDAIAVQVSSAPDLWTVRADPSQLERILVNLAANARDAMPDGGLLLLRTANVTLTAEDVVFDPELQPGDYVMLSVSDTGLGMSDEVQVHLFEPFYTTKVPGKGTGLGLATVYSIVKQSGGAIRVHSQIGQGTTFELYLPRVKELLLPYTVQPGNVFSSVFTDNAYTFWDYETSSEPAIN